MISTHEAEVASRFDALHGRFSSTVASDDFRLGRVVVEAVGPLRGLQVLDLGCGKGRFAVFSRPGGQAWPESTCRRPCWPRRRGSIEYVPGAAASISAMHL